MTLSVQLLQIPPTETVSKREYYLNGATLKIGRDFGADICLPDLSETMSRTHLIVFRTSAGKYTVNDISSNGALMNGETLRPKEPQALSDGDIVSFAGYKLLFGIVETMLEEEIVSYVPDQKFEVQTDISDHTPILPDAAIEELPPEPDKGFSRSEMDLDPDLMFDPFADGPEMREPTKKKTTQKADPMQPKPAFSDPIDMAPLQTQPALQDAHMRPVLYRENVSEAMELALERLLIELDPAVLQLDYDDYIPRLASRQKRYWTIHRRQFAKKKASGEFRRTFMALFAEELRKL